MHPIIDYDGKMSNEKVLVDFHYFIQSAVEKRIPWNALALGVPAMSWIFLADSQ